MVDWPDDAAVSPEPQRMGAPEDDRIVQVGRAALQAEAAAIAEYGGRIGGEFAQAVELLCGVRGKIMLTGIGKSGHVARKIAATFSSLGRAAWFVHPTEASHGDLGMIGPDDMLLVVSNSGETRELGDILAFCQTFPLPVVALVGRADSTLARRATVALDYGPVREVCQFGLTPTTSTTLCMAIGDALAVAMIERLGTTEDHFRRFHPGGKLGADLLRVGDLMHRGAALPVVSPSASMRDVILEMSAKGFGVVVVADAGGRAVGIITDGDMRRHIDGLMEKRASDVATVNPIIIAPEALAREAIDIMSAQAITSLIVAAHDGEFGLLHIHDCLRAGL